VKEKMVQALTLEQVQLLLAQCSSRTTLGSRDKAILMMLLDTGMRVSELASLNMSDVDVNSGAIVVRFGKGGKQRIVRMGRTAQKILWRYVAAYRKGYGDRLFLTHDGRPLKAEAIEIMVRRLGKKTGIAEVHAHRLRQTFAISYLRGGGDVFTLKYLLGHTTLQMTQRYLQSLNADDALDAHKKFSPLDNMNLR
jgi:site-specific recombinase XerD